MLTLKPGVRGGSGSATSASSSSGVNSRAKTSARRAAMKRGSSVVDTDCTSRTTPPRPRARCQLRTTVSSATAPATTTLPAKPTTAMKRPPCHVPGSMRERAAWTSGVGVGVGGGDGEREEDRVIVGVEDGDGERDADFDGVGDFVVDVVAVLVRVGDRVRVGDSVAVRDGVTAAWDAVRSDRKMVMSFIC